MCSKSFQSLFRIKECLNCLSPCPPWLGKNAWTVKSNLKVKSKPKTCLESSLFPRCPTANEYGKARKCNATVWMAPFWNTLKPPEYLLVRDILIQKHYICFLAFDVFVFFNLGICPNLFFELMLTFCIDKLLWQEVIQLHIVQKQRSMEKYGYLLTGKV